MSNTCAFITGITGQDGSYLAEFLLEKGYKVVGLISRDHDIGDQNLCGFKEKLVLEEGDLLDKTSLERILRSHKPQEIYNLGGISFVPTSWKRPALTYDVNAIGVIRLLEIVRDELSQTRFFQATSAKIFGEEGDEAQTEETAFDPSDPYGVSKLAAHLSIRLFRKHFSLYLCSGILYNHESERRGLEFVTRKITNGVARIKMGQTKQLPLGNLEAKADWGYAPDYVEGMWLMLQQEKPDDYILATGELHSVREVCKVAFEYVGLNYRDFVTMDEKFYRPTPSKSFYGKPKKAEKVLGWKRKVGFKEMIERMVESDLKQL
ncbi:MAG: GDP-mannose 4,6-dehydratase [Patescibacteria group bacterium]|jgi:GDPmannose 4,6-dehydratase